MAGAYQLDTAHEHLPLIVEQDVPVRIDVFTIFPKLITDFAGESLLGRAQRNELLDLRTHDLRDGATDRHKSVDDTPFGGGAGMVLAPEPVFNSVEKAAPARPLFLMSPGGHRLDQAFAEQLAGADGFSLLCGRYEGVDHRVTEELCDGEISIGDVVIAGGEVAALVVIEAVTRLIPGVMGNDQSAGSESFSSDGLLEYPQFTRPADFRGMVVPDVLLSGDHGAIAAWRHAASLARTKMERPDMIEARGGISAAEELLLKRFQFTD